MHNGFILVKEGYKCNACGEVFPSGIVTLSRHWAECSGKGFMKDIKSLHQEGKLSVDNLHGLLEKHSNNKENGQRNNN